MSTPFNEWPERRYQLAIDFGERIFLLLLFASFVVRIVISLDLHPYNVLVLISEGLIAFFIVIRRPAQVMTMRPRDWLIALGGTAFAMCVQPGGQPLLPPMVGTSLMFIGLLFAIWAKLILRRSFGLAAANRGAVVAGPYRLVRHPMYAGYVIVYAGFVLNNPLLWNFAVYAVVMVLLVMRILAEERILMGDPAYDAYSRQVRFRLLPALF